MYALCKVLYFTVFGVLSSAPPFLQIYYHKVLGFSSDQIGLVLAIAPFIQSLACPLWTCIADKRPQLHGRVMAVTSLTGGLAVMGIQTLGHYVHYISHSLLILLTSAFALAFAFFTLPNVSLVDSAVIKILGPNKKLYGDQRLWGSVSTGLAILAVGMLIDLTHNVDAIFWVFDASTVAFIVASLLTHVPAFNHAGADNFETASLLLPEEKCNTNCSNGSTPRYQSIAAVGAFTHDPAAATATATAHGVFSKLPASLSRATTMQVDSTTGYDDYYCWVKAADSSTSTTLSDDAATSNSSCSSTPLLVTSGGSRDRPSSIFLSFRVVSFLITTLLFGIALSMIVNFLFLFLDEDLHAPASWIGWTGPVGAVAELVCFAFSKQMMEHLGTTWLIVIAHAVTIFRCLAYTWLPPNATSSHICALLLQTLHGIGFGIFWGTAVSEMDALFPPEQRAMAQGVLGALHAGLGTGMGALVGGYLYAYLGAHWLFYSAAALSTMSALVFCAGRR